MSNIDPLWAAEGERIRIAAAAAKKKHGDLAREIGRTRQQLSRYLNGRQEVPEHLREKMANALGVEERNIWGASVPRGTFAEMKDVGPFAFGANVKALRERRGLSMAQLARDVGFHEAVSLEQLEAGRSSAKMRAEKLPKLAAALGVKPAALLRAAPAGQRTPLPGTFTVDLIWEIAREMKRLSERLESHGKDLLRSAVPEEIDE